MSVLEPIKIPQYLVQMTATVGRFRVFELEEWGTLRMDSRVNASLPWHPSGLVVVVRVCVIDLASLVMVEVEETENISILACEAVNGECP